MTQTFCIIINLEEKASLTTKREFLQEIELHAGTAEF